MVVKAVVVEGWGGVVSGVLLAGAKAIISRVSRAKGSGCRVTGCLPFSRRLLTRRVSHQAYSQRPLGFVPFPLAFRAAIPACARAGPTRLTVHAPGKITGTGVITRR